MLSPKMMQPKTLIFAMASMALLISGCAGGAPYTSKATQKPKTRAPATLPATEDEPWDDEPSEDEDSDNDVEDESDYTPKVAPYEQEVRGVGYSKTVSFTVRARKVLKMRFKPGMQDALVEGTGYSPTYAQLGVFVRVGTVERPTALLSNGIIRAAEVGTVMDFSTAFARTCASTDTDCRQTVTIEVLKPNYDYYCLNYWMGCPHTQVHENHPWNGMFEIETDDTEPLKTGW